MTNVAQQLRAAILARRWQPGERLVEERLSQEFGVSRVPIRESLRLLAAEGLVRIEPRRGATVATVSERDARDMIEARALLESLNARLAAERRDPKIVADLRKVLARGDRAAVSGKPEQLAALNSAYHDLLDKAGQNGVITDMLRGLRERTRLMFVSNSTLRAHLDWQEHSGILEAVVDGDAELAALLAARHVRRAGLTALNLGIAATAEITTRHSGAGQNPVHNPIRRI